MKYVHVLIDYDNVRETVERRPSDVVRNLSRLIPDILGVIHRIIPDSQEVWLRLYGGWTELNGSGSHQYGWLLSEISRFRGRRGVLRSKIALATELACRTDLRLVGTYRDGSQKMVDCMIAADLMILAKELDSSLVIASDDEDFVPGIIASAGLRAADRPIHVLRQSRQVATAPNDPLLAKCNVAVTNF